MDDTYKKLISSYLTNEKITEYVEKGATHIDIYEDLKNVFSFLDKSNKDSCLKLIKEKLGEFFIPDPKFTIDQLLKQSNIDPETFKANKVNVKAWQLSDKTWNRSISVETANSVSKEDLELFRENIVNDLKQYSPNVPSIKKHHKEQELMYLLGIADVHIGKIPVSGGTIKETKDRMVKSVESLLSKIENKEVDQIVLPIGNDFLNIDSIANTTTKGTPQSNGIPWPELFQECKNIAIECVDMCLSVAPTKIVCLQGNHNYHSIIALNHGLEAWYHNNENCTVDIKSQERKYLTWGSNLLGFTHGDKEKVDMLSNLMSHEKPYEWSRSKYRMWLLGHLHKKHERFYVSSDENFGVRVKILPSLSSTDSWHQSQGYVGNLKAAEGLLFSKKEGLIAIYEKNFF